MRFTLLAIALGTCGSASALFFPNATIGADNYKHINPPNGVADVPPKSGVLTQVEARTWTNAKRLAAGRPLKAPKRRQLISLTGHHQPQPSKYDPGHGGGWGKGSCLQVFHNITGNSLGYVSNILNGFGEYGLTLNVNDCLVCNSPSSVITKGTKYNLETQNGPNSEFPCIGVTEGDKTTNPTRMSRGRDTYGVLTAVSAGRNVNMGQKNSFSSRTGRKKGSRSSVWKVDTDTQDVGCNWDNDDDSSTDVSVGLNENTFVVTGDKDRFSKTYGPTTWVNLKYIPV